MKWLLSLWLGIAQVMWPGFVPQSSPPSYIRGTGSTTASLSLTGVVAGDLIVQFCAWDGTGVTVSYSDGTSSLTGLTETSTGTHNVQMFYLLSANSGTKTYTGTWSGGTGNNIVTGVAEFRCGGQSWSYDTSAQAANSPTSSVSLGPFSTTGSHDAIFWGNKLSSTTATVSNVLIGSTTPTEASWSPVGTWNHFYYIVPLSPQSGINATFTYSANTTWVSALAAFKCGS